MTRAAPDIAQADRKINIEGVTWETPMVTVTLLGDVSSYQSALLFPDFLLALTFFVSLFYAVLRRRLQHPRAAAAVALSLGAALAIGLVAWEYQTGWSITDLGPIAVAFALLLFGGVIYQALQSIGGPWSGAVLALGGCLLLGLMLNIEWPIDATIVRSSVAATLLGGAVLLLWHRRYAEHVVPSPALAGGSAVRRDLAGLYRDRCIARHLSSSLERARREAATLDQRPEHAGDLMLQLNRILPDEGALTERLAQLRATAYHMQRGHVARIKELRAVLDQVTPERRRALAEQIKALYGELSLETRISRLDGAVAENERRVRSLTMQARAWLANRNYPQLATVLESAEKLQRHNARLLRLIEKTEHGLLRAARRAAAAPDAPAS